MNIGSAGGWSREDFNVLEERLELGMDPAEIQSLFLREGLERMGETLRQGGFPRFIATKFTQLWAQDGFIVYWLARGVRDDSPLDIGAARNRLEAACNLFYGLLLGCCALSLYKQLRAKKEAFILPVTVLTGVVLLFLILEANPRYHYAGSVLLVLTAAGCVIPLNSVRSEVT
jgi:hypothetical protein